MSSDDSEGRVIPFPVLGGLRPPIGGGTATSDPPPPPQAPPADPETESGIVAAFPALAGVQLSPPLALTLPALAPDGEDQAADDDQVPAVHQDGGMTAREAATLGLMVASAITVACLRGTAAFASWCRTRAEHHRTVRAAAAKAGSTGGGRVPSSPEYGRATRGGGRGGTGSSGTGGGRSGGGGRAPAAFRSTGSGSRGAGGSTRHGGGTSRTPTASDSGKAGTGGRRRNGSGSGTSTGSGSGSGLLSPGGHRKPKTPKDKSKGKGTGDSGSDGGGKAPRGPKGSKVRKPKGSGSGSGGTSADGSGTSTSRKGKGKGGKEKGDGAKSPATRTPATTPATRGAKARALTRRTTTRAARGGVRLLRRGGGYVVRRTPPTARRVARRTHRVARHVRRWSRVQWERIAARAEARWERRQQAAAAGSTGTAGGPATPSSGPAAPGTGPTPPGPGAGPGAGSHGPGAAPGGPGPDGGPWIGYGPLTPPPAMTDPYAVTFERIDVQEQEDEPVLAELVVADGDTPPADAPPGQTWEPLRGVDGGWVLVDVAELVEPDPGPIPIPAARTEAATSKEAASVTNRPPAQATPSALAQGVAAMPGPSYDGGASELTIYDLIDADEDAAEEIVARVDTARADARAARALVGHMEALKDTIVRLKIPGALYRYACRLQEKAAALASDADALAKALPAASEAISKAGRNAAARHKPLADTTRDHGHAAPAEADYHG